MDFDSVQKGHSVFAINYSYSCLICFLHTRSRCFLVINVEIRNDHVNDHLFT